MKLTPSKAPSSASNTPPVKLTVMWSDGLHADLLKTFAPGAVFEVVRETPTQYIINPMGSEVRVSKTTYRVKGFKAGYGVQFQKVVPPLKPFICGKWHAWQGTAKVMLSDEESKNLQEFDTVTDCINWLFTNEQKEAARALNAHIKEG